METKKSTGVDQLLHARESALKQEQFSLRPLGKLWGMDVFAWYNASIDNIASTLAAFPFPVIWFTEKNTIDQMIHYDAEIVANLQWLGQYDQASMKIPADVARYISLVTTTENLEESLTLLQYNKQQKFALLFTANNENWKEVKESFENFVKINQ